MSAGGYNARHSVEKSCQIVAQMQSRVIKSSNKQLAKNASEGQKGKMAMKLIVVF